MGERAAMPPAPLIYGWVMVALAFVTGAVVVGQNYLNGILVVSLRGCFEISNRGIFLATTGVTMLAFGPSAPSPASSSPDWR